MKNDDRDRLDAVIDGALPGYSSAEPLEGLEDRVLERVHSSGSRIRWPYRWGFALAALLIAGIALWIGWNPGPRATNTRREVAAFVPPPPAPTPEPAPAPRKAKPKRRPNALPKEDRFPAPAPMTDEERALAVWAAREPAEAEQVLADLRKRSDEPVTIQAIVIPPLQIDGTR